MSGHLVQNDTQPVSAVYSRLTNNNNNNNDYEYYPNISNNKAQIIKPIKDEINYNNNDKNIDSNIIIDDINDSDTGDDFKDKYSLAYYMSTLFTISVGFLMVLTAVLFVWSNRSTGAGVIVKAYTIINNNEAYKYNENINKILNDLPFLSQFISINNDNNNNNLSEDSDVVILDNLPKCHPNDEAFELCAQVFSFTLTSSVSDFWQAKGYILAIVIGTFSGLWPYVKLLILMVALLVPMKQHRRSKVLMIIDQLGKYSFVDCYVTVIMAVTFYFSIHETLNGNGFGVDLVVEPDWGLTSFVIGTLISMIWSMILIYCDEKYAQPVYYAKKFKHEYGDIFKDKKAIKKNSINTMESFGAQASKDVNNSPIDNGYNNEYSPSMNSINKQKQRNNNASLNKFLINKDHDLKKKTILANLRTIQHDIYINKYKTLIIYDDDKHQNIGPLCLYYTPTSMIGVICRSIFMVVIICNLWLLYLSVFTAPTRYDIQGLVKAFIPDEHRAYTVWENVKYLPERTDMIGVAWFLVVVSVLTVIVMPILTTLTLILVWIFPFKMNYNVIFNYFRHIILIFQAWNAVDVFLLACIAASVELDVVSNWIINTNFAGVCGDGGIIPNILGVGCFSVKGNLTYGSIMLGVSIIIEYFGVLYTIIYLHRININYATKRLLNRLNNDDSMSIL